jgi:hypothetical protein
VKRSLLIGGMAALMTVANVASVQAAVFQFTFDNTADGTVTAPFTGTGTFSFDGPATAGSTVALTTLSNFAFDFTIDGNNFTVADLVTPQANILVQFTASGSDVLVNFGGSLGGPFNGSADFVDGGIELSFQPLFGSLYFSGSRFGTYQGVLEQRAAVPEPMSLGLLALGLATLAGVRRYS